MRMIFKKECPLYGIFGHFKKIKNESVSGSHVRPFHFYVLICNDRINPSIILIRKYTYIFIIYMIEDTILKFLHSSVTHNKICPRFLWKSIIGIDPHIPTSRQIRNQLRI